MDVTVDDVVIPFPQDLAEAAGQSGRRMARAAVDTGAELKNFGSVKAGVCAKSAEIKLKIRDVEVAGEIEEPGFDASGIESTKTMEDFEWRCHAGSLESGGVEASWE
jgi:hypothetical protein